MRRLAVLAAVVLTLPVVGCGGDDANQQAGVVVPVVNRTEGAVNTNEQATAGEGDRGVLITVPVGRTDPTEDRIPALEGIATTDAGDHDCTGRTHGVGAIWPDAGTSTYTFLCPTLPFDDLTGFEVHTLR
jgi:hypothetical protein